MKRLAFVVSSAALMVGSLVVVAAPAQAAATPHIAGSTCGFVTTDIQSPGFQYGVMWGGPLVMRDPANVQVLYTGTMTCTLKYGIFNGQHNSGGAVCATTGGPATGVVAAPPTTCAFAAPSSPFPDEAYICTQVVINAVTYYFSGGGWTTNANSDCERAAWVNVDDQLTQDIVHGLLDPILCPILAIFFPPQGDVGIFYDCPPYTSPTHLFSYLIYEWPPSVVV